MFIIFIVVTLTVLGFQWQGKYLDKIGTFIGTVVQAGIDAYHEAQEEMKKKS